MVGKLVGVDVVTPGGGDETVSWRDDYGACDRRTEVHTAEVHTADEQAEQVRQVRQKRGSTSSIAVRVQVHQVQVQVAKIEFHPFYITYGDVVPTGKQQRLVY